MQQRHRHREEPTGPAPRVPPKADPRAGSGRPEDRLRDEAIQLIEALDCLASLAMTDEYESR